MIPSSYNLLVSFCLFFFFRPRQWDSEEGSERAAIVGSGSDLVTETVGREGKGKGKMHLHCAGENCTYVTTSCGQLRATLRNKNGVYFQTTLHQTKHHTNLMKAAGHGRMRNTNLAAGWTEAQEKKGMLS